jgi:acyl carrier protein
MQHRLQAIFRRVFNAPDMVIKEELTAWDVPGWDSLANMQLMLDVETEFRIRFSSAEISGLKRVGDLLALIRSKTAGQGTGRS